MSISHFRIRLFPLCGFSFLAAMIAIFSGAQLFSLGIMGEYLARMHARSMQHPTYSVAEMTEPAQHHAQESPALGAARQL